MPDEENKIIFPDMIWGYQLLFSRRYPRQTIASIGPYLSFLDDIYINFVLSADLVPLLFFYSLTLIPAIGISLFHHTFSSYHEPASPAAILDILLGVFVTDRKSCVPSVLQMKRNLRVLWTVPPLLRFYVSLLCLCFWWFYYTRNPNICQYFFQKFFKIFASSFVLN